MANRNRVYVARKECGCIVAAFPVLMDKAVKGKILEQLAKAGFDIEQTDDYDVQMNYRLNCAHNKPPLLDYIDKVGEKLNRDGGDGVDQKDVDALGNEDSPEADEAEEAAEVMEGKW